MLELLDGAQDPEARAKLLSSLARADKAGLAAVARDEACMQTLHTWLCDLTADKPAFHVLELLLKACPAPLHKKRMKRVLLIFYIISF